ncbi:NlpC/P60 family protein [Umezawaea sp. Da 62-37]|uniref:C40 family peptidase n=1 Tax=Umezawaea sp. Da 62-37 TaxID=3075927 RepID=UPI0028F705FB|nr:NlpC/P60 family protein [Umezawaea sp. Da 62-37]WNV84084.1 NlpC/P60 family protein [Umezawaea sp. Da 62-37]
MSSQPRKRIFRGALAATAVAASVIGTATCAQADPASEALQKYNDLSHEAEVLNADHLKAQDALKAAQDELGKANADFTTASDAENAAKATEEQFRGQVDLLTEASFEGARFNNLSALLVAESQQDFLNRMSAISVLAADNNEALGKLSGAVETADQARNSAKDAQGRATKASDDAAKAVEDIDKRAEELDGRVKEAKAAYNSLSSTVKNTLSSGSEETPISTSATGDVAVALNFALAQRGEPYVFGSNGPDSWDCSSLMQKSYAAAGISIGRTTYAQAVLGRAVSRSEVQPGDLVIYYADQGHVAMVVDSNTAVHASTEGVPVKTASIDSIGPINTIRRIVG